jgi:hypothetical protein
MHHAVQLRNLTTRHQDLRGSNAAALLKSLSKFGAPAPATSPRPAESKELTLESTPPQQHPQKSGTMVGLFWIESEETYLGMPPVTPAPGVVLSPAGPRIVGPDPLQWHWSDVTDLRVTEVPIRSTATRWATRAATVAAAALNAWVPGSPAEMTVVIAAGRDEVKTPVFCGASIAYSQHEVDLSHALLARFVRGASSPAIMSDWWDRDRPSEVLRSRHRETLLESWL